MSSDRPGPAAGLLSAAAVVLVLSGLLRTVNALQQAALAAIFGAGPELDAYATAASLPSLLTNLVILGPLGLTLTPLVAAAASPDARQHVWQVAGAVLSLVALVSLPLILLGVAAAPVVVRALAPGLEPGTLHLAADLFRVLLPAVGCAALAAVLRSILHGLRRFTVPLVAYLTSGAVLLAATVGLGPSWGIGVVAWATLIGAVLGLVGQGWVLVRQGARLRFAPSLKLAELRPLGSLLAATSVAMAATQLFPVWGRLIASYLGPGQVALLDFALNGDKLVAGTVAMSVATVSYPGLVAAFREDPLKLGKAAGRMLRTVGFTAIPATMALVALREPLLRVWLQHGQFGPERVQEVGNTLLALAPALLAWSFLVPFIMTFHARGRMRTAAGTTLVGLLGNTVAAGAGAAWLGLPGIGAGTSLAAVLTAIVMGTVAARQIPGFRARSLLEALAGIGAASLAGGLAAWLILHELGAGEPAADRLVDLLHLGAGGAAFIGGTALAGLFVPVPELRSLFTLVKTRIRFS